MEAQRCARAECGGAKMDAAWHLGRDVARNSIFCGKSFVLSLQEKGWGMTDFSTSFAPSISWLMEAQRVETDNEPESDDLECHTGWS